MSQNQTQTYIPKFSYPFKDVNSLVAYNEKLSSTPKGNYLFTQYGIWHGAPHFYGTNFDSKIQVIADGELVAYRLNSKYLKNSDAQEGKGAYSTGFFLVRHKLEYPTNNKLTFFSLYMHTAKKDAYNIIQNQTNQSNTTNYYTVKKGDTLGKIAKEHHTTVDKLRQDNNIVDVNKIREGNVLIIKPFPSSQPTQNTPPPQTNPNSNPNFIVENPQFDKVVVLPTPIKIKAAQVIGLMGEYNQQKESDNKVLHLEVFANEEFNTFVQTAQRGNKNLPQSFSWAKVLDTHSSNDNISIFENIEVLFQNNLSEDLKLNVMFKDLFNLIDKDQNGQMEVQEISQSAQDKKVKEITNNYIVKHSSEWDKNQNMADKLYEIVNKNQNELENAESLKQHYLNEKERIYNLSFFEECKGIQGFPQSDMVYVMNVIGLVNQFNNSSCGISVELLNKLLGFDGKWFEGRGKHSNLYIQTFDNYINVKNNVNKENFISTLLIKMKQYNIDKSCVHVAHFLTQIIHESDNFNTTLEYSDGSRYEPNVHPDAIKMENTKNGDGTRYRGRGLIQLTWKKNYRLYGEYKGEDFVSNPDLLGNNIENAIDVSCYFWRNLGALQNKYNCQGDINILIDNAPNDVSLISQGVNGGRYGYANGLEKRKKIFMQIATEFNLNIGEIK